MIKAIGVASDSVTTTSQNATAPQNQALGQLQQTIQQLRNSSHNAAAARLKQLLQEFHALQQFGTASARALAALAKEIGAAAGDLSEGAGNGATPTTDTSFSDEALAGGQTPDDPAATQGDEASAVPATSPTAATSSDVSQLPAGRGSAPPQSTATDAPASKGQAASRVGSQTSDSRTATTDPSSNSDSPGALEAAADQRQALIDHLNEQAGQNAAQSHATSADRELLTEAANAVGAIRGIVKQAAEEEQEKHKGKGGTQFDQLAKTVASSAAGVEEAIGQIEIVPASTPSISGADPAVGVNITV
jgi:hypothetical protein